MNNDVLKQIDVTKLLPFVVLIVVLVILKVIFTSQKSKYTYVSCKVLMTPTELRFFRVLYRITADRYYIFSKVRLGDLVRPLSREYTAANQVNQKHIDFLICDSEMNILVAVELDDTSHARSDRRKSDKIKNDALASADIKLVRILVEENWSQAIRDRIDVL